MSRIAYVNGLYVPHTHACVSIEDRACQFADAAYEVIALMAGRAEEGAGESGTASSAGAWPGV